MDDEEIPSVQFETQGIPNERDVDYIYHYHASIERARADEARQNEEALREAKLASDEADKAKRPGDDPSPADGDSDSSSSDSDDDDAQSHRPETESTSTDTVTEPTPTNAVAEPTLENAATGTLISLEQGGDKAIADQTEALAEAKTDGELQRAQSSRAEAKAAGPSAAAQLLAAQLLAKHTATDDPALSGEIVEDDDDSSDDSSDDGTSYRMTHEELEEMILREEGKVQNVREPEDSEPAPKFPEVTVGEQDDVEPVGLLHAFVDKSLHFWQDVREENSEENDKILLEGSVICLEDRRVLGGVYDMIGPMRAKKLYQIKYNKDKFQEIKSWNLERGTKVFRVSAHSTWGHVNQFTAGDEAFDEVYEGDDDVDADMTQGDIDDAEVLMRRQQEGGRGGRAGRRGGFQDRGRGRGRGRGGHSHPRGHNQFRGGRANYPSSDHGNGYGSRPTSSYGQQYGHSSTPPQPGFGFTPTPPFSSPQPSPAVSQYNPALGQGQPAMTPQHFQALMMNIQQVQRQAQQQGQIPMPPLPPQPYTQPFINQNFQQPPYNPFAWGAGGQMQQPPQMNTFQQQMPQPPDQAYQATAVPQFGSALPQPFQGSANGQHGGQRGRGRGGRGRGGPRPRHPDDPSELY